MGPPPPRLLPAINTSLLLRLTLLVVPAGLLAGSASAFFLWSLDLATRLQHNRDWLLYLLPLAGVAVAWTYQRFGRTVEPGNNLIIDEIHAPTAGVPLRMAPLVLLGTLLTHLCGGSAGREGTAVQMGGSLASAYSRRLRLGADAHRILLMAGVAAGFGSVFGTPWAGAVFAVEVLVLGRLEYRALPPVLVASFVGDWTCHAWGAQHPAYHIATVPEAAWLAALDPLLLTKVVLAALAGGVVARLFAETIHRLTAVFRRFSPSSLLRAALGGLLVIGLVYGSGSRDYLGLGVIAADPGATTLFSAFTAVGSEPWSWAWKFVFTAVTLAAGFKGGEVTPLFFIGATLGASLAGWLDGPVDLLAGIGLLAVFAGATNTPLACTLLGLELFGAHYALYFAVACFIAYHGSGHSGIYLAQRIGVSKFPRRGFLSGTALRDLTKEPAPPPPATHPAG